MGRPKLPDGERKSELIVVRLSAEDVLDLDMVAFDQDFSSRSDMIRFHLGELCASQFEESGGREAVAERYKAALLRELDEQRAAIEGMA